MLKMPMVYRLVRFLENNSIPAVRTSSAKASGFAARFSYWGSARYEFRLSRRGEISLRATVGACSSRRSLALAEADTTRIAETTGAIKIVSIGRAHCREIEEAAWWVERHRAAARAIQSGMRALHA